MPNHFGGWVFFWLSVNGFGQPTRSPLNTSHTSNWCRMKTIKALVYDVLYFFDNVAKLIDKPGL